VNVYLRLWLTCLLLSAICCCRLCLFRVLLDACPFCFLQYTALPTFCNCRLFCMRSGPPPLWWHSLHDSGSDKPSPLQAHWGRWRHSCLLLPACLFAVLVSDCPSPTLWGSGHPTLFATSLFFPAAYLLFSLFFFSFFPPEWWGRSVQGAMLIWPRVVCGSTACRLAHLVVYIFPSSLGAGIWWCRSPSGFSV
jgi:hypothetical protein